MDNISELASSKDSNIIDDSATYYVAGFLIKLFLEKSSEGSLCSGSLREGSDNLNWPHQYFIMLKASHIPGKMFGNLTVPSEATFTYTQSLESHCMCVVESVAHLRNVCDVLYHHLSRIVFFAFMLRGVSAEVFEDVLQGAVVLACALY